MSTPRELAIARIWRGRTRRDRADEHEAHNYEAGIKPLVEMGWRCRRSARTATTKADS